MIGTTLFLMALSATPATTPLIQNVQFCALNMQVPFAEFHACIDGETEIMIMVSKENPCGSLEFGREFSELEIYGKGSGQYIAFWKYEGYEPVVDFTDDIPFRLVIRQPPAMLELPITSHGVTITF